MPNSYSIELFNDIFEKEISNLNFSKIGLEAEWDDILTATGILV